MNFLLSRSLNVGVTISQLAAPRRLIFFHTIAIAIPGGRLHLTSRNAHPQRKLLWKPRRHISRQEVSLQHYPMFLHVWHCWGAWYTGRDLYRDFRKAISSIRMHPPWGVASYILLTLLSKLGRWKSTVRNASGLDSVLLQGKHGMFNR